MGAYITALGAVITLISVWLSWVTLGPGESEKNGSSGYEADSVIPFIGYLGIAFAIALLYATVRADRRQHRGLSVASMAVGLASLLWVVSFLIDPIATVQYAENVTTEIGVYIATIGTLIWTLGSFLLAKEPEGDVGPVRTATAPIRETTTPTHTTTERLESRDVDDADVRSVDGSHLGAATYSDPDLDTGRGTTGSTDTQR